MSHVTYRTAAFLDRKASICVLLLVVLPILPCHMRPTAQQLSYIVKLVYAYYYLLYNTIQLLILIKVRVSSKTLAVL